MPGQSSPTIPARERERIVRALRGGSRLFARRIAGVTTATLDGKPIPAGWLTALGRQSVITPTQISKIGNDSVSVYGLTLTWREDAE